MPHLDLPPLLSPVCVVSPLPTLPNAALSRVLFPPLPFPPSPALPCQHSPHKDREREGERAAAKTFGCILHEGVATRMNNAFVSFTSSESISSPLHFSPFALLACSSMQGELCILQGAASRVDTLTHKPGIIHAKCLLWFARP